MTLTKVLRQYLRVTDLPYGHVGQRDQMFSFDHRHVEDGFVQRFVVAREHPPSVDRLQVRYGQPPVLHCTLRTTKAPVLLKRTNFGRKPFENALVPSRKRSIYSPFSLESFSSPDRPRIPVLNTCSAPHDLSHQQRPYSTQPFFFVSFYVARLRAVTRSRAGY